MNYLIVLLLLFGTDFTCSMRRRRPTQEISSELLLVNAALVSPDIEIEMVPFDTEYTDAVKNFITDVVSGYYDKLSFFAVFVFNIAEKIWHSIRNSGRRLHECDKEPNPLVPGTFKPTESSKELCRRKCASINSEYVTFLEDATSKAIDEIFLNNDSRYTIKLFYPIHETQSDCVYCEKLKIFTCSCTILRYRIMVSKFLKDDLETAVELRERSTYWPKPNKKIEFFAFVLLLKYHPRAALLYLSYLTFKHKLHVYPAIIRRNLEFYSNSNTEISTENLNENSNEDLNEGSLTDCKGPILKNETEIFRQIIQKIYFNYFNLREFGHFYFNPVWPIGVILWLVYVYYKIFSRTSVDEKLE